MVNFFIGLDKLATEKIGARRRSFQNRSISQAVLLFTFQVDSLLSLLVIFNSKFASNFISKTFQTRRSFCLKDVHFGFISAN